MRLICFLDSERVFPGDTNGKEFACNVGENTSQRAMQSVALGCIPMLLKIKADTFSPRYEVEENISSFHPVPTCLVACTLLPTGIHQ